MSQIGSFPQYRGEHEKYLKPPPSQLYRLVGYPRIQSTTTRRPDFKTQRVSDGTKCVRECGSAQCSCQGFFFGENTYLEVQDT